CARVDYYGSSPW
nr:immunoglobulin heavy chain junction region [Mus musculus]